MKHTIPVLLDCDTGPDDAFAIAMCIASEEIDVLGITTVAGNYTLPDVLLNTRRTLSITDKTVPYAVGSDAPLCRQLVTHGQATTMFNQLGDPKIDPVSLSAVDFMAQKIRDSDQLVTLLPLGPLTNIALFFRKYPELKAKIKEMVIMGGSVYSGNKTANSEFNIFVDPEAAQEVFEAGVPIVMFGLEVCNDAFYTKEDALCLKDVGNKAAEVYAQELLGGFNEQGLSWSGYPRCIVFDAATVLWLLHPDSVETKDSFVQVMAGVGTPMDGCTFTDFRQSTWGGNGPNAKIAMSMDTQVFQDTVLQLFKKFS